MTGRTPRVYTASKLIHAEFWKHVRGKQPEIHFTARWPYFVGQIPDSAEEAAKFWQDDAEDVARSDAVIVYAASPDEHLRGALVEAGMALAQGKLVVVVGSHPDYGTWQFHPLVEHADTVEAALGYILTLDWS